MSPRSRADSITVPAECAFRHEGMKVRLTEMEADSRDHEVRLRDLEKLVWKNGLISALAAAFGGLLGHFSGFIK